MFEWTRFWCPRNGTYSLGDSGYLTDPEEKYGKLLAGNAISLAKVLEKPCVALLGEPGIGKSTALASIGAQKSDSSTAPRLLRLNLSEYGDEGRLERDLLDSPDFRTWLAGASPLELFLDSLDECRIRIPNVAAMIVSLLRRGQKHISQLKLRIACRTLDWPEQFERDLPDLWGDSNYAAFELLPLRQRDVEIAAKASGLDERAFLKAIFAARAQPLAIKPITLKFLIGLFKRDARLPASQVELYNNGCLTLATEMSVSRRDARHIGTLDANGRLAIASRIAAVMTLCGKSGVNVSPATDDASDDTLAISALTGGSENAAGATIQITEASIREVLDTALFSGRSHQVVGFAHQTYAEYLTARYLVEHQLGLPQLKSVMYHPGGSRPSIVPQLGETAAWLASMNQGFFRQIMHDEPQLLLRSDAARATHQDRMALTESLLEKLQNGELVDSDWVRNSLYPRIRHPQLSSQLIVYIPDRSKNPIVRRVAIDIAEACELTDLQDLLVQVALDRSEISHIRDQAIHAIACIGDDDHRRQLQPLLNSPASEDPDDQICGNALGALWPKRLVELDDILSAIHQPRNSHFYGAYQYFWSHQFISHLRPDETVKVLKALQSLESPLQSDLALSKVADSVVSIAWQNMADEGNHILTLAELLLLVEVGDVDYPLELVGLSESRDDLVDLLPYLLVTFNRHHVRKGAALGYVN